MAVTATGGMKPVMPDVNKAADGIFIYDDGVAGTQSATFTSDMDGVSLTNCSDCYIVAQLTYNADVVAGGDGTAVIAPGGSVALSFQDINIADDEDAVTGVTVTAIDPAALAVGATLGSAAAATPKTGEAFLVLANAIES